MAGRLGRLQRVLLAAWALPFIAFFVLVVLVPEQPLASDATQRGSLRVYSSLSAYREIEAAKAVEFGLEKLYSVVNYLLLTTAAVLGFIIKTMIDYRSAGAKGGPVPKAGRPKRTFLLLFLHAGIACFFSLTCGATAFLSLPNVTVLQDFAVSGHLSECVLGQIAGLLFAVFCLLVALGSVVRDLLP